MARRLVHISESELMNELVEYGRGMGLAVASGTRDQALFTAGRLLLARDFGKRVLELPGLIRQAGAAAIFTPELVRWAD